MMILTLELEEVSPQTYMNEYGNPRHSMQTTRSVKNVGDCHIVCCPADRKPVVIIPL